MLSVHLNLHTFCFKDIARKIAQTKERAEEESEKGSRG